MQELMKFFFHDIYNENVPVYHRKGMSVSNLLQGVITVWNILFVLTQYLYYSKSSLIYNSKIYVLC